MYKYLVNICLFILVTFSVTGCSSIILHPADVMQRPKVNAEQQRLKEAVNKYLPDGAALIVPSVPDYIDIVRRVDIDGDNQKEALTFYQIDESHKIGLLLLKKIDNRWVKKGWFETDGKEISSFKTADLNQDYCEEILLGCSLEETNNYKVIILSLTRTGFKVIDCFDYSELEISDLNDNGKPEILVLRLDWTNRESSSARAVLYEYVDDKMQVIATRDMNPFIKGYYNVVIGQASRNKQAVFLDIGTGTHSFYTDMLIWENGQLVSALQDPAKLTYKPYMYASEDINNDGIIEIPLCKQLPGYDDKLMVDKVWINTWHKWNPDKTISDAIMETFCYYPGRYLLKLPDRWGDKITIHQSGNDQYSRVVVNYLYVEEGKEIPLLQLYSFEAGEWNKRKDVFGKTNPGYIMLGRYCNKVTVGVIPVSGQGLSGEICRDYQEMTLDEEELKALFRFNSYGL